LSHFLRLFFVQLRANLREKSKFEPLSFHLAFVYLLSINVLLKIKTC